jgi:hypothetical protein
MYMYMQDEDTGGKPAAKGGILKKKKNRDAAENIMYFYANVLLPLPLLPSSLHPMPSTAVLSFFFFTTRLRPLPSWLN